MRGLEYDGDETTYTNVERAQIMIEKHHIFRHSTLRINYTTYDVRRDQDLIVPGDYIMVMSHEDDTEGRHPFWYALVLGIFHAEVAYTGTPPVPTRRMDFLWVKWMGLKTGYAFGWAKRRHPRVGFIREDDSLPATGFLDPKMALRASYMMPVTSKDEDEDEDEDEMVPANSIDPFSQSTEQVKKHA